MKFIGRKFEYTLENREVIIRMILNIKLYLAYAITWLNLKEFSTLVIGTTCVMHALIYSLYVLKLFQIDFTS